MNKQIKAYIFDMDGTLVDNCAYYVKAWRKFSKKYGHELTEREILDWMGAQGGYYIEAGKDRRSRRGETAHSGCARTQHA